ncbi:uncharacterized protein ASCRUDRAFT_6466 [Ascoidea rubescens DSM 1968]|uniref:Uncharacterized protein n=1 Tax=Ascoidea rubescens DSM 1968 TaxID=1344418 RepID=A0A1D2VMI4_9ASCO|nr:hypothetical protein ASCRUDRAFT_6466 [Ascoidea rubescens DSM 1968]ODV62823.1 hypothetical protein ASCRUDRAFT_6466 [Ascoidea rubescens DSM 1968]
MSPQQLKFVSNHADILDHIKIEIIYSYLLHEYLLKNQFSEADKSLVRKMTLYVQRSSTNNTFANSKDYRLKLYSKQPKECFILLFNNDKNFPQDIKGVVLHYKLFHMKASKPNTENPKAAKSQNTKASIFTKTNNNCAVNMDGSKSSKDKNNIKHHIEFANEFYGNIHAIHNDDMIGDIFDAALVCDTFNAAKVLTQCPEQQKITAIDSQRGAEMFEDVNSIETATFLNGKAVGSAVYALNGANSSSISTGTNRWRSEDNPNDDEGLSAISSDDEEKDAVDVNQFNSKKTLHP